MKKFLSVILLNLVFIPQVSFAQDGYKLTGIKPEVVFTPKGFDDNDNAQIILYGRFSDVCHKIAQPVYSVDKANHKIYIQNRAYTADQCIALVVAGPYTVVINLDTLPEGSYDVLVADEKGAYAKVSTLPIASAKKPESVDDYLYAQVNDVQFTTIADGGTTQLVLKGILRNSCLTLRDVKVTKSEGNVYDVLPIMEVSQSNCLPTATLFERTISLGDSPISPALLNIRTSGGQSIEKVIDERIF